jgi:integrase
VYNIYRRSRTDKKSGKTIQDKVYTIRFRLPGDLSWRSKVTKTSDKQSAEQYAKNWHLQKEREFQGLAIPEAEIKAATSPVGPEIEKYLADLVGKRCTKDHVSNVKAHLKLLCDQCGWKRIQDIKAASFTTWRAAQGHRAPKTLNEFLGSARAFCSWLVDMDKLTVSPLNKIKRSETRGQERRKRRVLSIDELTRLLAASKSRGFVYAFAFYTGIRRNELANLLVTDLGTSEGQWMVTVRASISKNRQSVLLPIHHALVPALEKHLASRPGQRLLFASIPRCDTLRKDLQRAGIEYKDAEGRQADFHSLRHATSTHLGASHAAPRAQMSMMRHQDMKLTMGTYTDEAHISRREAIEKLPNILELAPIPLTHPLTHGLVVSSPKASPSVATEKSEDESQSFFMEELRRGMTPVVAIRRKGRKAAALGLEPRTPRALRSQTVAGGSTKHHAMPRAACPPPAILDMRRLVEKVAFVVGSVRLAKSLYRSLLAGTTAMPTLEGDSTASWLLRAGSIFNPFISTDDGVACRLSLFMTRGLRQDQCL